MGKAPKKSLPEAAGGLDKALREEAERVESMVEVFKSINLELTRLKYQVMGKERARAYTAGWLSLVPLEGGELSLVGKVGAISIYELSHP